jgi:hypothetical protein
MTEPRRLLDEPSTPAELREALGIAAAATPAVDTAGGVARLEAAIRARALLKAVALLGGGVIAIVIVWSLVRAPTAPPAAPPPPPAAEPSVTRLEEPSEPASRSVTIEPTVSSPVVATPAPPVEDRDHVPRVARLAEPRVTPAPGPDREIGLVGAARRALDSDPSAALAALDEADRAAPHGVLLEEREGLRVLALGRLGRREEAARRGELWLREHPAGTMAARVRAAIANDP